jgi:hypothetical protein
MVMTVPWDASSRSSPMMLLPSASRAARPTRIRELYPVAASTKRAAARAWSPSGFRIVTVQVFTPSLP